MPDTPRKASLLVVFLIVFIDLIGFGIVLPLLPLYAEHFKPENPGLTIGLLMASFSAMQFLFAPMWGRLSDRIGRRPVLMIGLAGSVVFYLLFAVASTAESLALLFLSRIGAGIAGATISTAHAYIADVTSLENRTKGMALVGAAFGLGFTFGPMFAWLAVDIEGQGLGPGPGYAASALSAVALLLAWFRLAESLKPGQPHAARKWFDFNSLAQACRIPSVGLLLLTSFICVFSFGNFESTLSLTLRERFDFGIREICQTFAFIGIVLMLVQGGIVRRFAGKVRETVLAAFGALLEIFGFSMLCLAGAEYTRGVLMLSLAIIVSGFAFITPSLNALISRRSDPARQGSILGVAQSISSLARILGPMFAVPLLYWNQPLNADGSRELSSAPFWLGIALMCVGLVLVIVADTRGRDYPGAAARPIEPTAGMESEL
ncbi:MAG TPA: MFS transporter [Pirellulales bacterium]|nr:MFS transporter [Pirellulales bacterium]